MFTLRKEIKIKKNTIPHKTMTPKQALEVLKLAIKIRHKQFGEEDEIAQALTIAIECMDGRKEEIIKAWDNGWDSGYNCEDIIKYPIQSAEQYYNSLPTPAELFTQFRLNAFPIHPQFPESKL